MVCLLPDREAGTAEAWPAGQPQITVVVRDRSGNYALAAARALPHAAQVAARWYLMENASRAFDGVVRQSMRAIRQVIGATTLNPALLTAAERIQYGGYLRRGGYRRRGAGAGAGRHDHQEDRAAHRGTAGA